MTLSTHFAAIWPHKPPMTFFLVDFTGAALRWSGYGRVMLGSQARCLGKARLCKKWHLDRNNWRHLRSICLESTFLLNLAILPIVSSLISHEWIRGFKKYSTFRFFQLLVKIKGLMFPSVYLRHHCKCWDVLLQRPTSKPSIAIQCSNEPFIQVYCTQSLQ